MEVSAPKPAGRYGALNWPVAGSNGRSRMNTTTNVGAAWRLGNPFSFKVLQVFTGLGVGCGIGIGVGKPVYLGAVPALQQVLSTMSGAIDVFSGAGRHVNSNLRRFGVENLEVGIGCGVGIGHGFGVGIALKPGVIHRIQTCFGQALAKIMNFGTMSGLSAIQHATTDSVCSTEASNRSYSRNAGTSFANVSQRTNTPVEISPSGQESGIRHTVGSTQDSLESKAASSEMSMATRSERVISTFLQNPIFKNVEEVKLDELAGKLRSENNMLQMLLKHQKVIDELIEENARLRQVIVEDLHVSPSKLQMSNDNHNKSAYPCSDCIECRRKRRSSR